MHRGGCSHEHLCQNIRESLVDRPVLRYHGGKFLLADWIISHFPPHRVYVEPFGGGGSVLMQKPRSYGEVYNDKWDTVVNVFRVLRDPAKAEQLEMLLTLTPYARTEFILSYQPDDSDVERARKTIVRSFMGFGSASTNGDYPTGFRANSNRSGTTPAMDWANYPKHIGEFAKRLRGVTIENREAVDVIRQHDSAETLFYVDPPYPHSTRNFDRGNAAYAHEMSDEAHRELASVLREAKGMILLSSYPCSLYDDLYDGWIVERRAAHADGAVDRVECLWMNPACAAQQRQQRLIG